MSESGAGKITAQIYLEHPVARLEAIKPTKAFSDETKPVVQHLGGKRGRGIVV